MEQATIKATVTLEKSLWVVIFERTDKKGYAAARHIFGNEPTDPELYKFILANFNALKFTTSQEFKLVVKRKNPKRMQREVKREMERVKSQLYSTTQAQEALKLELEKNKKQRKIVSKTEKEKLAEEKFLMRQARKKKKKRGH